MSHTDENIVSVNDAREVIILFQGKLQFQYSNQHDNIYVLIALHTHHRKRIIKIVSYSFSLNIEAKRLFINYDNINAIIDQEEVQKRFHASISAVEKVNPNAFRNVSVGKCLKTATHDTIVAYLLDHLVLSEYNQLESYYALSILSDKGGYEESDSSDADALEVSTTRPPGIPALQWTPPAPTHDRADQLLDSCEETPHTHLSCQKHKLSSLFDWFRKSTGGHRILPTETKHDGQDNATCVYSNSNSADSEVKVPVARGWRWRNKALFSFHRPTPTATAAIDCSTGSMKTVADTIETSIRMRGCSFNTITTTSATTTGISTTTTTGSDTTPHGIGSAASLNPLPELMPVYNE